MNPDKELNKQSVLRLLKEMIEHAQNLNDVLWSQEDLVTSKAILTSASVRIHETVELIRNNFQWYQIIGWKQFLQDRDQVEVAERTEAVDDEKKRFRDWLAEPSALDLYRQVHRKIPEESIARVLRSRDIRRLTALDIGCRDGRWLKYLSGRGASPNCLAGIELHKGLWSETQGVLDKEIQLVEGFPDQLPFPDHSFDIVLAFGTFMFTLDRYLRSKIGAEILRVLHPQGTIFVANATETFIAQLEPYLSFATQTVKVSDLALTFPDCDIEVEDLGTLCIATIRTEHEDDGHGT